MHSAFVYEMWYAININLPSVIYVFYGHVCTRAMLYMIYLFFFLSPIQSPFFLFFLSTE